MSINVTVNGNPVKIHKGKMVTESSNDMDKRRKMRLQQVRQQSKDLAASVRNNVKKVKNKQQTAFEKENQTRLKEWQNRKLLELHNHYEECLKDIGLGHAQAQAIEIEEKEEAEREQVVNEARANHRGKIAQEVFQVQKNEASLKKAIPRQARQIAREVENARAAMIASQSTTRRTPLKKKIKKKTTQKAGSFVVENASNVDLNELESESESETEREKSRSPPVRSKAKPPSATLKSPSKNLSVSKSSFHAHERIDRIEGSERESLEQAQETSCRLVTSPKKKTRHEEFETVSLISVGVPQETRISERIRSRYQPPAPSVMADIPEVTSSSSSNQFQERCDNNKENQEHQANINLNRTQNPRILSRSTQPGISIPPRTAPGSADDVVACPVCINNANQFALAHTCHSCNVQNENLPSCSNVDKVPGNVTEIPFKPPVRMPPNTYVPQDTLETSSTQYRRVKSYDCKNHFGHNYVTDTSHVERINREDLIYCDDSASEAAGPSHRRTSELTKLADERAKMAQDRGKKALEREKVKKDFKDLMKKLPILQKQDRIAGLNPAKDKFHMSDDRKKQHERQRQQQMENAYERLAPTATRITLPPRSSNKQATSPRKGLFKVTERKTTGTWKQKEKSPENRQRSPEGSIKAEKENLFQLLEKLKNQKEELMKESKDLPEDSNFYNLIDELDFVTRQDKKSENKKVQTEFSRQSRKYSSSSSAPPRHVLILQNTSTQTSPKVITTSGSTESSDSEPPTKQAKTNEASRIKTSKTSTKTTHAHKNVCDCKERDKLCEILIKIREGTGNSDDVPEVVLRRANRLEDELNLETASPRKTPKKHERPDGTKSVSPKRARSRSESPKKSPGKSHSPRKIPKSSKPARQKMDDERPGPSGIAKSKPSVPKTKLPLRNDSWKHYLSISPAKVEELTSSTSYYSPPDYNQQARQSREKENKKDDCCQQQNMFDPKILKYINRLLQMSKGQLDNMAANLTSISDVTTPSSSIINTYTNRPQKLQEDLSDSTNIEKLSTLLKYFNLTTGDLKNMNSSSAQRTRTNSTGSSTTHGNIRVQDNLTLENFTETQTQTQVQTPTLVTIGADAVDHFSQWAEICQLRISKLAAMIDKVRMEKQQMLQSPTNHDNATSYMNLPSSSRASSSSSSSDGASYDQKQLTLKMLEVNDKATSTGGDRDPEEFRKLLESSKEHPDLDREIVERYMKLIDVELKAQRSKSPEGKSPSKQRDKTKSKDTDDNIAKVTFTPMLDIPKLPKFQPQPSTSGLTSTSTGGKSRKPPITNNALRYNEIFHELSAIPEADNSRLSKSPQSRKSTSPKKRTPHKSSTPLEKVPESSDSTSEKSNEVETVESMLKNIGLDWAIPTLKKMNAMKQNDNSSSSSSLDLDLKKFSYLVSKNVTTSTEKSGISQGDLTTSQRLHRTSTPVQQTTNSSKDQRSQRLINSGESEISPVAGSHDRSGPSKGTGKFSPKQKSYTRQKSPVIVDHSFETLPCQSVRDDSDS